MEKRHLLYSIFPEYRASKVLERERKWHLSRKIEKQLIVSRLLLPSWIRKHICEYAFSHYDENKQKRLMRKIVYIFKNAIESRINYEKKQNCQVKIDNYWIINLSRKTPNMCKYSDLPPPRSIIDNIRNHFIYNNWKYGHLKECRISATNCIKCGQYMWKRLAHHYREFDYKPNERKWYKYLASLNKEGIAIIPYVDRLECNCVTVNVNDPFNL